MNGVVRHTRFADLDRATRGAALRLRAAGFGFTRRGPDFDEGGNPHTPMRPAR